MSRICCDISIKLLSDTIFSSGNSIPGGEDIAIRLDPDGSPVIPGSTVKGLLREAVENYLCWTGGSEETLYALFGREGRKHQDADRRLIFDNLKLTPAPVRTEDWRSLRTFTKIGADGLVEDGSLRIAACLRKGLRFTGMLFLDSDDRPLLDTALKSLRWVGLMRSRGFGRVEAALTVHPREPVHFAPVENARFLHYRLRTVTPLSIPWISRSGIDSGDDRNFTESRNYLPGSAVRGMVMGSLSQDAEWFAANKQTLLRQVRFLDAFPGIGTFPTPAGFYADKQQTRFYSIVTREDVEPGDKRAHLGSFCTLNGNCIEDSSPAMQNIQRIDRGSKAIFNVRAIAPGTVLEGYIVLRDPGFSGAVAKALQREYIWLGADRYAGCGLCRVECVDTAEPAYFAQSVSADGAVPETLYMELLSPTAMIRAGEPVGLDEVQLACALGVEQAEIQRCSAAVTESSGFNAYLGCREPSAVMYSAGSIFRICTKPAASAEKLRELEANGIGIRCAEGYGQVLFLKNYPALTHSGQQADNSGESRDIRFRQARARWLLRHADDRFPVSASQLGNIQALLRKLIHQVPEEASGRDLLRQFFAAQSSRASNPRLQAQFARTEEMLEPVWNTELNTTLHCPDCIDSWQERLQLISDWIDLGRKGAGRE